MATNTRLMTADELLTLDDRTGRRELLCGVLHEMGPAGGRHGRIAYNLSRLLGSHVDAQLLGQMFISDAGFLISRDPDTVRVPDVAFVSAERLATLSAEDEVGFLPLAPDVAIEVISPSDRFFAVEQKALAWLEAGTRLVLLANPERQTVHAYRGRDDVRIFVAGETCDASDAVPGWSLTIDEVFR